MNQTRGKILRASRRFAAIAILVACVLFLSVSSVTTTIALRWVAGMQLVPAVLSGAVLTVAILLVVTLLFGRIYCSVACPWGVLQDIFARMPRLSRRQRAARHYTYQPARNAVRLSILVWTVLIVLVGSSAMLVILDPYALFSRIVVYDGSVFSGHGVTETVASVLAPILLATVSLVAIAWWSALKGRAWCNHVCPVGTLLGLMGKNALMHIDINTDKCINCRKCEHECKSRCIDLNDHVIDMSRCVVCMDCLTVCPNEAISYTYRRHRLSTPMMMRVGRPATSAQATPPQVTSTQTTTSQPTTPQAAEVESASTQSTQNLTTMTRHEGHRAAGVSRRQFLVGGAIAVSLPFVKAVDSRIPDALKDKPAVPEHRPVPPPGTRSISRLLKSCVACGACVRICPEHVIEPTLTGWGVTHPLVPMMNYRESSCRFDCNYCTQVCPTGALAPLTIEEKQHTAIGLASVDADTCVGCGRCERACPTKAITMIRPAGRERRLAMVNHADCIGCGACQTACPVNPVAIVVNGLRL